VNFRFMMIERRRRRRSGFLEGRVDWAAICGDSLRQATLHAKDWTVRVAVLPLEQ
jgi:hypothetical protein